MVQLEIGIQIDASGLRNGTNQPKLVVRHNMKQAKQTQIRRFVGRRMQANAARRKQRQSLRCREPCPASRHLNVVYLLSKLFISPISFMVSAQAVFVFLFFA